MNPFHETVASKKAITKIMILNYKEETELKVFVCRFFLMDQVFFNFFFSYFVLNFILNILKSFLIFITYLNNLYRKRMLMNSHMK